MDHTKTAKGKGSGSCAGGKGISDGFGQVKSGKRERGSGSRLGKGIGDGFGRVRSRKREICLWISTLIIISFYTLLLLFSLFYFYFKKGKN